MITAYFILNRKLARERGRTAAEADITADNAHRTDIDTARCSDIACSAELARAAYAAEPAVTVRIG